MRVSSDVSSVPGGGKSGGGGGGFDKVSMWTHTYPHNPPRKIKVTICSHPADNPLYVWPDV